MGEETLSTGFTLAWPWLLVLAPVPLLLRWLLPEAPSRGMRALKVPWYAAVTGRGVHDHAELPRFPTLPTLHVDELEAVLCHDRLDHALQLFRDVPVHVPATLLGPKNGKSGRSAHFTRETKAGVTYPNCYGKANTARLPLPPGGA